jgi:RsiW-degrading membrane proteinase PrsW (M82 family)
MTQEPARKKQRLPLWLSWPVLLCAPLVLLLAGIEAISTPLAILLALVPLAIVGPALVWLDLLHPQAWSTRVHALLWGATVAVLGAALLNGSAEGILTSGATAVVVAPVVEETFKGLGVLWALRRREIDGPMDGILIAGWVGLGFAVVEDIIYFAESGKDGALLQEFLLRGLLTPFAHPMVTFWTGLAVGIAVYQRRHLAWALWGFAIAVATHMLMNGVWEEAGVPFPPLGIAIVVALLVIVATVAIRLRRREGARFIESIPSLQEQYGLSPTEATTLAAWDDLRAHGTQLSRDQRRRFDAGRGALARLVAQQDRPGGPDPERERELTEALQRSRTVQATSQ